MKDAWDTYVAYAWGYDEVKPNSKGINDRHGSRIPMGTSIVDSMSTLYIMGLDEEFQKGREWIAENFDFNRVHADVSVCCKLKKYLHNSQYSIYNIHFMS